MSDDQARDAFDEAEFWYYQEMQPKAEALSAGELLEVGLTQALAATIAMERLEEAGHVIEMIEDMWFQVADAEGGSDEDKALAMREAVRRTLKRLGILAAHLLTRLNQADPEAAMRFRVEQMVIADAFAAKARQQEEQA